MDGFIILRIGDMKMQKIMLTPQNGLHVFQDPLLLRIIM